MKKVLKRTGIIYNADNPEHQGKPTELITVNAQRMRVRDQALVEVLVDTGIIYDSKDPEHQGKRTEQITAAVKRRRVLVKVLVGTGVIYDSKDPDHQGKFIELITAAAQRQRVRDQALVTVLAGTGILYDATKSAYKNQQTEMITAAAQRQRANQVEVLAGTGILYDATKSAHKNQPTEMIARNVQRRRANQVKVLAGTGILYDATMSAHKNKSTEMITTAAQRWRARRKRKKSQACNESGATKPSSNGRPRRMVVEAHGGRDNELVSVEGSVDPISKALDACECEDATPIVVSSSDAEFWGASDAFTCDSLLSDGESDAPVLIDCGSPTAPIYGSTYRYSPHLFSPSQSVDSLGAGLMESDDETDMFDFDDNCSVGSRSR